MDKDRIVAGLDVHKDRKEKTPLQDFHGAGASF